MRKHPTIVTGIDGPGTPVSPGPAQEIGGTRSAHRIRSALVALAVAGTAVIGLTAVPAGATTTCTGDYCVVDNGVPTPLGPVTVTVSAANVVTVTLTPNTADVAVFGLPFSFPPDPCTPPSLVLPPSPVFPPGPSCPAYTRTVIATFAGTVNVDTIVHPPSPIRLRNIAVISIYPPTPVRARTTGNTVVFTPIVTPAPK